jgi:peptide chain release factor 1
MSFQENLNKILSKHQELSNKLASGIKGEEFIKCSKEYSRCSACSTETTF